MRLIGRLFGCGYPLPWPCMACVLCWSALPNVAAFADVQPSGLSWNAPVGCPTSADVRALLSRAREDTRNLMVHAVINAEAQEYVLDLRVRDDAQRFTRTLRASDCDALAQSAVWLIELAAVQLTSKPAQPRGADSMALADSAWQADRPVSTVTSLEAAEYLDKSPPSVTHDRDSAADGSNESAAEIVFAASAAAGVVGVGLTGAAPELSIAFDAQQRRLHASVRVGAVLHGPLMLEQQASLSFHSAFVELAVCDELTRGRWRTGPCAAVEGWLTFVGHDGLRDGRSESAPWLNAGGLWRLLVELHPALQLSVELGVSAGLSARPSFAVSERSVAQVAPVAGHARIAYGLRLW